MTPSERRPTAWLLAACATELSPLLGRELADGLVEILVDAEHDRTVPGAGVPGAGELPVERGVEVVAEADRKQRWPLGRRPDGRAGLSELGL